MGGVIRVAVRGSGLLGPWIVVVMDCIKALTEGLT